MKRTRASAEPSSALVACSAGMSPKIAAALDENTRAYNLPCAVTEGGLHYKFDPTIVDALETNEVWVPVTDHSTARGPQQWVASSVSWRSC